MGLKGGGSILLARPPRTQDLFKKYISGGARWMRAVNDSPTALYLRRV